MSLEHPLSRGPIFLGDELGTPSSSRPSLSRLTSEVEKEVAEAVASNRVRADSQSESRDSDGKTSTTAIEMLIHEVEPKDSIMAVALKYGIDMPTLRKVNKLWASDPIHLRTKIYVPLDSCSRGNVVRGPQHGEAIIRPHRRVRNPSVSVPSAPPLIRLDSGNTFSQAEHTQTVEGEIVTIHRISPSLIHSKKVAPRASIDNLRNQDRPKMPRSTSLNYLVDISTPAEPRTSTSSSRPSLDLGWATRPASRNSLDGDSESSIEMKHRIIPTNLSAKSHSRPPRNLWFSVADDGIDPGKGLF